MKSVLISIQPKWCELIASGKKTVEVRKTKPKLDTPFKVYIYETKRQWIYSVLRKMGLHNLVNRLAMGVGKVVGEFVCDSIETVDYSQNYYFTRFYTCLKTSEMWEYGRGKPLYAWHISNLVIYDKPKELYEFKTLCTNFYDGKHCEECDYFIDGRGYEYDESDCGCDGLKSLTRPPQSWCYVESEVQGE